MSQRVRIILADDHPLYLEGVARAIAERPEFELVATAPSGREALELVRKHTPDVAVLDINIPDLSGIAILHAIVRDALPTRVILLSGDSGSARVLEAVREGAAGYLTKEAGRREICDAISAVARGQTVLSPQTQAGLASAVREMTVPDAPSLTSREREVLQLIADGVSGPDIAKRLHLSPSTIKSPTQTLYEKLGVSERAAAVAEAMRRGLLE
jgi:two-component system nitrate/nitrite response regulator NarL